MSALKHTLSNPYVRLAGRALLAAATVAVTQIHTAGGTVAWHAVAVASVLAFAEVFTPLNSLVGLFKQVAGVVAPAAVAPVAAAVAPVAAAAVEQAKPAA